MDLTAVLEAIATRAGYITCSVGAAADEGWLACADLITDPEHLRAVVDATAAGRGTDDAQVAMSLFVQGYAFRLPSVAVAAWALGLPSPTVAPEETAIRIGRHRPAAVAVAEPTVADLGVDALVEQLIGGHLALLVDTAHQAVQIGRRLLWGDVAASLAVVFRAMDGGSPSGDPEVRARASSFFAAAEPWLGGLGSWSTIEVPGRVGWYWDRTSCCLWYRTESGFMCDDCSRRDPDEQHRTRCAALAQAETAPS